MSGKEIAYFTLVMILYIFIFLVNYTFIFGNITSLTRWHLFITIVCAIVFMATLYGFTTVFRSEGYEQLTISPGKVCSGGAYMNQGDSYRAKMCRNLAATPEGRSEISRYQCGAGYVGMPGKGFRFTPISDNNWKNARCIGKSTENITSNGIF